MEETGGVQGMNGQDCKNAFGKAPESFKSRITFTLSQVKEEPKMKKLSIRLVLIAALLLLLMAGAVYAASTEWKILDFVTGWYYRAPTANLQVAMRENDIRQTFEAGDFEVTLEEAIADGRYLYISANARIKNGEEVYFLPMNIAPGQRVCDVIGSPLYIMRSPRDDPMYGQFKDAEKMFTEDPPVSDDTRTLHEAAIEDGKRLISASMWVKCGDTYNEITSFTALPDGGISFVLGSTTFTEEKTLDAELYFTAREVDLAGVYEKDTLSKTIPLELTVTPIIEKKEVDVSGYTIEKGNIQADRVEFELTPLTLHYRLYFTADHDFRKGSGNPFYFMFLSEKEKLILPGLTIRTFIEAVDETHFVQIGSLLLDKIPETLILQGHDVGADTAYEKWPIHVE
jgi:hypothetical protein